MVFRMPRPTARPGTANRLYRRRIPEDVRRILDRLPDSYRPTGWGAGEITITLGTSDARKAAAEHARIADQVEQHMQGLRAGPRTLTRRQAVALAGVLYTGFTEAGMVEPQHDVKQRAKGTLHRRAKGTPVTAEA